MKERYFQTFKIAREFRTQRYEGGTYSRFTEQDRADRVLAEQKRVDDDFERLGIRRQKQAECKNPSRLLCPRVARLLAERGPLSARQIAECLSVNLRELWRAMRRYRHWFVAPIGGRNAGQWELSDEGKKIAKETNDAQAG